MNCSDNAYGVPVEAGVIGNSYLVVPQQHVAATYSTSGPGVGIGTGVQCGTTEVTGVIDMLALGPALRASE